MSTAATDLPGASKSTEQAPLRFVTAASLFDGHDAAINIMRRLIQAQGVEVVHLGHNRSVDDIVRAAIQEDADGIAISSYQGGHNEFFRYMVDRLRELGAGHIKVFGGGGGTITPEEITELMKYGVERIYHPHDGMQLGLEEMIRDLVSRTESARRTTTPPDSIDKDSSIEIASMISALEENAFDAAQLTTLRKEWQVKAGQVPVIGVTGTGGAGKSSVTDEILNRFLGCYPDMKIAVLAVDPTSRRTGGALLGDRIRMNSLRSERVFMRSIATRRQHLATSEMLGDNILFLKSLGFDLVIVETAGIGQSDSEIVDMVDFSVYVMTSEYGAPSQLEKIDMLDFADLIGLNTFDKRGAEDALRDIRKQWKRNHTAFKIADDDIPVYPTIASQFNDPGISWMFAELCRRTAEKAGLNVADWTPDIDTTVKESRSAAPIPGARIRYLAEIAEQGRAVNSGIDAQAETASQLQHLHEALRAIEDPDLPGDFELYEPAELVVGDDRGLVTLRQRYQEALQDLTTESIRLLQEWPARRDGVRAERYSYTVRGKELTGNNYLESLSHQKIPKIAAPDFSDWGETLRFLSKENLPGAYPYTGGVFPYRRLGEDPTRMFAGEGTPEKTNRRFHYLSQGQEAARLSTAFDSVTLYGEDPHERPDIFGKVGNSGVSIASVDDMKKLYSGFDLCAPTTSVSMTINGPAPMVLAFFMNTAIDQQVEKHLRESGEWEAVQPTIDKYFEGRDRPHYNGDLPPGNEGLGLGCLVFFLEYDRRHLLLCVAPCRRIS